MNPSDYLKDVPQDNYFRLADGRIIKNLEELFSVVQNSGDTVFFDHVTPDRNDFASWIKECVNNQDIFSKLIILKDRQSFLNVLSQEIAVLKNPKITETMKFFSEDYDPKKENQKNDVNAPPAAAGTSTPTSTVTPAPADATSGASVSPGLPASSGPLSESELDFEQVLGSIIQEIQEEIFFWQ